MRLPPGIYQLTPAGRRLASYLSYIDGTPDPTATAAPVDPALARLQIELDHAQETLFKNMHADDSTYNTALDRVKLLRVRIAELTTKGKQSC